MSDLQYYTTDEFLNLYAYLGAFFIIISGIFSIPGQYKQMKVNDNICFENFIYDKINKYD